MPRITIARSLYDLLNKIFLLQERQPLQPQSISDEIMWTIPWLPETLLFKRDFHHNSVVGAAGVGSVSTPSPAAGTLHYVFICGAFHNEAVARKAVIQLVNDTTPANAAPLVSTLSINQNDRLAVNHHFMVPEGNHVNAALDAIGAGSVLELHYFYVELQFGDPIPRL